ncbi:MAG: HD domain-containing protein [Alphaproteobacteria bacterium]|nr:HD domain-containing protein [Alphaproteobacteria bacterium]
MTIHALYTDFIKEELKRLEAYDATRPAGHVYEFHKHVARVARNMKLLALEMGLGEDRAETLYQAALLHDAGKRLLPVGIWDMHNKPDTATKNLRRQHTHKGVEIINDMFGQDTHDEFLDLVRDLALNHHEAMDGSGWLGRKGNQLSLEARMLCICDAFDGYSVWRPHYGNRDITPAGVIQRMAVEKAGQFDPDILKVFSKVKTCTPSKSLPPSLPLSR